MGRLFYKRIFLMMGFTIATCTAWAQPTAGKASRFELALSYDSLYANVTTSAQFWMQGGSIQAQARLWHGLGVVADLAGLHTSNVNNSGVGLDLITATFGPRYTFVPMRRVALFGHVLAGEAHGMNSEFPTSTALNSSANSLALQIGGGINLRLNSHFSARVAEANWLRTQLPNATTNVQNNMRLGAGIVFRF